MMTCVVIILANALWKWMQVLSGRRPLLRPPPKATEETQKNTERNTGVVLLCSSVFSVAGPWLRHCGLQWFGGDGWRCLIDPTPRLRSELPTVITNAGMKLGGTADDSGRETGGAESAGNRHSARFCWPPRRCRRRMCHCEIGALFHARTHPVRLGGDGQFHSLSVQRTPTMSSSRRRLASTASTRR